MKLSIFNYGNSWGKDKKEKNAIELKKDDDTKEIKGEFTK